VQQSWEGIKQFGELLMAGEARAMLFSALLVGIIQLCCLTNHRVAQSLVAWDTHSLGSDKLPTMLEAAVTLFLLCHHRCV